jgi:hypothetical protein
VELNWGILDLAAKCFSRAGHNVQHVLCAHRVAVRSSTVMSYFQITKPHFLALLKSVRLRRWREPRHMPLNQILDLLPRYSILLPWLGRYRYGHTKDVCQRPPIEPFPCRLRSAHSPEVCEFGPAAIMFDRWEGQFLELIGGLLK